MDGLAKPERCRAFVPEEELVMYGGSVSDFALCTSPSKNTWRNRKGSNIKGDVQIRL
jgi:hypothetical protein